MNHSDYNSRNTGNIKKMTGTPKKEMKSESHVHGDPLLQAALKHDEDVDIQLRKFVKQEHEKRASACHHAVGDKSWYFHDIFPNQSASF